MSSPNSNSNYDVFLSFRGDDTRRGFTSHLYAALIQRGYKAFFDDEHLQRGKVISKGLMKAIDCSRSSVVVLSENYAFSSWCLTELAKIVERMETKGLIVLPIFYHVNPCQVRKQTGTYRDAFKKHENNPELDLDEVDSWRDALKAVSNLAGWTLDEMDVEAKFIRDFIDDVSSILDVRRESARQSNVYFDRSLESKTVNPANAHLVVGKLLDDEYPDDFIKAQVLSLRSLLPVVGPLVEECEMRNRLHILTQFLENLVSEGSQDVHVHNALGKIIIDNNENPEHFLTTNPCYDSRVVGKYCEKQDNPILAVVAYRRGQCDDELINVTNKYSLFKLQARYVVERMDCDLWKKVLDPENEQRRHLIDQVVSTASPESKSPDQISSAVKAFMCSADLLHELVELIENIVLQDTAFSGNFNLQNLLILSAIKANSSKIMYYINRLDNFDGHAIGEVVMEAQLYEEAFAIFKKFNLNFQAVSVLLDNIGSINRAVEFAFQVEEDAVWRQVQLREGRC
ncbi:hypothetical protein FNV43_RR10039 [Rhamnella rubrinervis]|uniref:TIR domain-containing protein n=1 Tax=Rhamnella rubrinervis TaxID=2594499 RepID=A0A8K0HB12_9ROSA|nr:hypothetical protein FNV43_RR10039 [Rhamnella rubrinervis]